MAFGAVLPALGAACAYPDFMFGGGGGKGGDGAGGEPMGTSSAQSSSASASASASSSSSGAPCEVQHPAGGTCEYLPGIACGCSGSKKCSVTNESTGISGCVFAGSTPDFGHCSSDGDCRPGSWCNHATTACQPICANNQDCANGGQCQQAFQTDGTTPILDLKVCAAHCDLVTAKPCGAGLTCVYLDTIQEFDCYHSLGAAEGGFCNGTMDSDCAPKLGCFGDFCTRWCAPASFSGASGAQGCLSGELCYSLNSPINKTPTVEYGFCQ
jgi:hypothetical protein